MKTDLTKDAKIAGFTRMAHENLAEAIGHTSDAVPMSESLESAIESVTTASQMLRKARKLAAAG